MLTNSSETSSPNETALNNLISEIDALGNIIGPDGSTVPEIRDAYFQLVEEFLLENGPLQIPTNIELRSIRTQGFEIVSLDGQVINDYLPRGIHIWFSSQGPAYNLNGDILLNSEQADKFGSTERITLAHEIGHALDENYPSGMSFMRRKLEAYFDKNLTDSERTAAICFVFASRIHGELTAWENARLVSDLFGVNEDAFASEMDSSLQTYYLAGLLNLEERLRKLNLKSDEPISIFDINTRTMIKLNYQEFRQYIVNNKVKERYRNVSHIVKFADFESRGLD